MKPRPRISDFVRRKWSRGSLGLMLYGSYSRGEESSWSDIDVLRLVDSPTASQSWRRFSVSNYTANSLRALANSGSLFVLHLIVDGQVVLDQQGELASILKSYRAPATYEPYLEQIRVAANLLDVDLRTYTRKYEKLHRAGLHLLRCTLYATMASRGNPMFSMRHISRALGDRRIMLAYQLKNIGPPAKKRYDMLLALLAQYLGTRICNPDGSVESHILRIGSDNPMAMLVAQRIQGRPRKRSAYDLSTTVGEVA